MHFVYFLFSPSQRRFYIGRTDDLPRRINEHLRGKCYTTSRMGEFIIIGYEAFNSKDDAVRRERYFKTTKGRTTLRLMYRESLLSIHAGSPSTV
jgi:putative endonuclease